MSQPLYGVRVLLVEDDLEAREGLSQWLTAHGAHVTAMETAEEALEALVESRPHVLLADIGLPGMSGYALMRRIRALPREQGGQMPSAAVTVYASPTDRIEAIDAGFWDHVPKPVDPQLLIAVVMNLVRVGAARPVWTNAQAASGPTLAPEPAKN